MVRVFYRRLHRQLQLLLLTLAWRRRVWAEGGGLFEDLLLDEKPGIRRLALTDGDKGAVVGLIRRQRRVQPKFSVLDIGAVANPWSIHSGVADAIFDLFADHYPSCFLPDQLQWGRDCCSSKHDACFDGLYTRERCCRGPEPVQLMQFVGDVTDEHGGGWKNLQAYVAAFGKFDFVVTSHVLEDLREPSTVVRLLPMIAKAGFVAVPSKFYELTYQDDTPDPDSLGLRRKYRGCIHHHWIYTVQNDTLLAVPKLPYLEEDAVMDGLELLGRNESLKEMALVWTGRLPMKLLNQGFMGPTVEGIVQMVRDAVGPASFDDVDRARLSTQQLP
ncbi:OS5_229L [Symbiodinium natans]|uniref:OS5_229L protein n=1 Tax=Symbiodinium natans TaxID=878477 RepID=A0A812MFV6_9DINO|nr:OS5_229L [Symbiodinium natans]